MPAGDLDAAPLKQGDRAPFTGQLLSTELAIELSTGVQRCLDKKELEVAHEKRACKLKVDSAQAVQRVEVRALEAKLQATEAALKAAQEAAQIPFWQQPQVVVPMAFVAGVIVAGGGMVFAIWGVGQLRPALPLPE